MNYYLLILDEINEKGKVELSSIFEALKHEVSFKMFEKIINNFSEKEFIEFYNNKLFVDISSLGVNHLINLRQKTEEVKSDNNYNKLIGQLKLENLKLQNENLQQSKDFQISELIAKNLKLQNHQIKWKLFYIISGIIFGFITSNFSLLLNLIGIET